MYLTSYITHNVPYKPLYKQTIREAEDDYSDESNAEVGEDADEFEGLVIYHEDDME